LKNFIPKRREGFLMSASVLWEILKEKSRGSEFEIHTVPQNKSVPLWFLVGVKEKHLIIKKAKLHTPSVKISIDRLVTFKDFEFVYGYYDRWIKGETGVRQEVSTKSQNTAYIFALIAEAAKVRA
jgi:hypothetical protein